MLVTISICLSLYIISSFILLRYPNLLHKKKKYFDIFETDIIAHRGSRMEGLPENTISSFKHSCKNRYISCIECDLWRTKDNYIIVHHDKTYKRMTGKDFFVRDINYKDIPKINPSPLQNELLKHLYSVDTNNDHHDDVYIYMHSDDSDSDSNENSNFNEKDIIHLEWSKIPLFKNLLKLIKKYDKYLIIEFKYDDDELIQMVYDIIKEEGLLDKVIWFSLINKVNQKLKNYPKLPRITSVLKILQILFFYYIGLLPFLPINYEVLGVPVDKVDYNRIRNTTGLEFLPDWLCYLFAKIFGGDPPLIMLPKKLFSHLRKRGIPIWLLGINDEHAMNVAMDVGATGLLSDKPGWLGTMKQNGILKLPKIKK